MAFTKITENDTINKGVRGLPDTPNLSTSDMQAKLDELATEVIIPIFNKHIDELQKDTAATSLGAKGTKHANGNTVQSILEGLDNSIASVDENVNKSLNISINAEKLSKDALSNSEIALSDAESAVSSVSSAVENLTISINEQTHAIDPTTGEYTDLKTIIVNMYNMLRPAPITAQEYDEKNYTAETYDLLLLTAYNYDMYAKNLL